MSLGLNKSSLVLLSHSWVLNFKNPHNLLHKTHTDRCVECVLFLWTCCSAFLCRRKKKTVCDNNCSLKPNLKHLRCCYSQPCLNQFRRLEGWVCDPFDDETRNTHWFNLISRRLRYMGVILSENKWVNICTVGYEFKISPHFLMPSFISSAYLCCLIF